MSSRFITAAALSTLLSDRSDAASLLAAAIVADLSPDRRLRLGAQPAARTATTLKVKYMLARERGAEVVGLENTIDNLTKLSDTPIRACVAEGSGEFALVFLDDEARRVEAALHVVPTRGEGA